MIHAWWRRWRDRVARARAALIPDAVMPRIGYTVVAVLLDPARPVVEPGLYQYHLSRDTPEERERRRRRHEVALLVPHVGQSRVPISERTGPYEHLPWARAPLIVARLWTPPESVYVGDTLDVWSDFTLGLPGLALPSEPST